MREVARKATGEIGKMLRKIFPKYKTRDLVDIVSVFKQPKYLKIGATILAMILKKAAKLGINSIISTLSGGTSTAAKVLVSIKEKYEQIKLFMKSVMEALDPNGILDGLELISGIKKGMDFYKELKSDLGNRGPQLNFTGS